MPGIFHETSLDRLEAPCLRSRLRTKRHAASRKGRGTGLVDLLVSDECGNLLLIEYETDSPKRVIGDVQKRRQMGEDAILWIVCPTERLARRIRKKLGKLGIDSEELKLIRVFTFFTALKQLENNFPFCSPVVGGNKKERKQKSTNPENL